MNDPNVISDIESATQMLAQSEVDLYKATQNRDHWKAKFDAAIHKLKNPPKA